MRENTLIKSYEKFKKNSYDFKNEIYDYSLITKEFWWDNYKYGKTKLPLIYKKDKKVYYLTLENFYQKKDIESIRKEKIKKTLKIKNIIQIKQRIFGLLNLLKNNKIYLLEPLNFYKQYFIDNKKTLNINFKFICKNCNLEFNRNLLNYNNTKCPVCGNKPKRNLIRYKNAIKAYEEYLKYSNKYTLLWNKTTFIKNYKNTSENNLPLKCPNGHIFYKSIINLKNDSGCIFCAKKDKWTENKFLKSFKNLNLNKYFYIIDFKKIKNFSSSTKVKLKCKKCKKIQSKTINNLLNNKNLCSCRSESKGENKIRLFLIKNKIKFTQEFTIKINNKKFRFDFHLPDYNIIIEYDGIQHFEIVSFTKNIEKK